MLLLEDRIIQSSVIHKSEITRSMLLKSLEARQKLTKGKPALLLTDITNVTSASKGARIYGASKEYTSDLLAIACVARSPISVLMLKFFTKIQKPLIPVKFFISKEKGFEWLKNIKDQKLNL